mgnify:CR=1 FL=1
MHRLRAPGTREWCPFWQQISLLPVISLRQASQSKGWTRQAFPALSHSFLEGLLIRVLTPVSASLQKISQYTGRLEAARGCPATALDSHTPQPATAHSAAFYNRCSCCCKEHIRWSCCQGHIRWSCCKEHIRWSCQCCS